MKIAFVSDIACPWCAIGLAALEKALEQIGDRATIDLRFEPFELNPQLGPEGEDAVAHLTRKYGISAEQAATNAARLQERAREVGLEFSDRLRVWNTFDAHRLLYWAAESGGAAAQWALKRALLQAYHGEGRNPGERGLLVGLATLTGLDGEQAARVLDQGLFADEVRAAEAYWQRRGISAVPSVIVEERHLVQGAQAPQVYERVLRRLAATGRD